MFHGGEDPETRIPDVESVDAKWVVYQHAKSVLALAKAAAVKDPGLDIDGWVGLANTYVDADYVLYSAFADVLLTAETSGDLSRVFDIFHSVESGDATCRRMTPAEFLCS